MACPMLPTMYKRYLTIYHIMRSYRLLIIHITRRHPAGLPCLPVKCVGTTATLEHRHRPSYGDGRLLQVGTCGTQTKD